MSGKNYIGSVTLDNRVFEINLDAPYFRVGRETSGYRLSEDKSKPYGFRIDGGPETGGFGPSQIRALPLYKLDKNKINRLKGVEGIALHNFLLMNNSDPQLEGLLGELVGYGYTQFRGNEAMWLEGIHWSQDSRTTFVIQPFEYKGERYAGYEIKGFAPKLDRPYIVSTSAWNLIGYPNGPFGGMMASAAEMAFNNLLEQTKVGKTEPFPLLFAELPISVTYDGNDGFSKISGPIGIYVRARKTNLDLGMRYDLVIPIIETIGMSAEQYGKIFRENLVHDLLSMLRAGQVHLGLHSQNVSILGNIKDEEDFAAYQHLESQDAFGQIDQELASTIGYVLEHLRTLRHILVKDYTQSLWEADWRTISEKFGENISNQEELFLSSRRILRSAVKR